MRKYLDPHTHIFDAAEWGNQQFEERLSGLVTFFEKIQNFEKEVGSKFDVFQFQICEDIAASIYENNPFSNDPENPTFAAIFNRKILPDLLARIRQCPMEHSCYQDNPHPVAAPSLRNGTDEFGVLFQAHLTECGSCGEQSKRALYFHPDKYSCVHDYNYFSNIVDISNIDIASVLSSDELWPNIQNKEYREHFLISAVHARKYEMQQSDPTWSAYNCGNMFFSKSFWTNLHRADFRSEEAKYKNRILESLVQISCARDIDIREHRMVNQEINIDGTNHLKWSADVFQSGASAQDRRCSRIYFAKIRGGFYINEFNPDAH